MGDFFCLISPNINTSKKNEKILFYCFLFWFQLRGKTNSSIKGTIKVLIRNRFQSNYLTHTLRGLIILHHRMLMGLVC
jgi:hypothetical protein